MRNVILSFALWGALSILITTAPAGAMERGERALIARSEFTRGLELYRANSYAQAAEAFENSRAGLKIIDDYILYYKADAERKADQASEALRTVSELVRAYPSAPVIRKAMRMEVDLLDAASDSRRIAAMGEFVKRYPTDNEVRFRYATLLMEAGKDPAASRDLFLDIYKCGSTLGDKAADALGGKAALKPEHKLERALSLMKSARYAEAEGLLRDVLRSEGFRSDPQVTEQVGHTLFLQKRYSEALIYFETVGERYYSARCLLRSGQKDRYQLLVERMKEDRDPNAAGLLISLAEDMRRDGDYERAVLILREVIEMFPSSGELAGWSLGWALYNAGHWQDAQAVFAKLHDKYGSNRYAYWAGRALERQGKDAAEWFGKVKGIDYYAVRLAERNGQGLPMPSSPLESPLESITMTRIDTLESVGLVDEAADEVAAIAAQAVSTDDLLALARRLMKLGRYNKAIQFMTRIPESDRVAEIMYPLAFWDEVRRAADGKGLDPLLVLSVMREESRFDYQAVSAAGARGLMQLMPETARRIASNADVKWNGEGTLNVADNNIRLGVYYLRGLHGEFRSTPAALAAYNAGSSVVRGWVKSYGDMDEDEFIENIPYLETRNYVKRILTSYHIYRLMRGAPSEVTAGKDGGRS